MNLPDIVRTYWPIAAFITPFVLGGGFAWLRLQFPTKADLEKLRKEREEAVAGLNSETARQIASLTVEGHRQHDRLSSVEHRVDAIFHDLEREPTKAMLSKDIGKVAERVGRIEAGVESLNKRIETHNDYLHTLVEKGLK